MTGAERTAYRVFLDLEWRKAQKAYRRAGKPFGEGRGLEVWGRYGTLTTVN